jgi:hypothetical protein
MIALISTDDSGSFSLRGHRPPMAPIQPWRVDEVTIDEVPVDHRQAPCGVGIRSSLRATNVGEVPAHFYAYWECDDVQ